MVDVLPAVAVDGPGCVGVVDGVNAPAGTFGFGLICAPAGSPSGRFGTKAVPGGVPAVGPDALGKFS